MTPLPPLWQVGASVLVTAVVAVCLPLATYTLTLAVFGIAHVLTELRYVDQRFGPRVALRLQLFIGVVLVVLVNTRALSVAGWLAPNTAVSVELLLGAALAAAVLPPLWRAGWIRFALGGLVTVALLAGLIASPIHTLVLIAVLHNFTPLGFLAERFEGAERGRVLAVAGAALVGMPLLIATGLPYEALASLSLVAPDAGPLTEGPVNRYMGSYLPPEWIWEPFALNLFTAAVFAQCMHYAVVIHVLPKLVDEGAPSVVPWPRGAAFWAVVLAVTAILFVGYLHAFNEGKSIYAIAAAVHAWIEVPLLLLALCLPRPG